MEASGRWVWYELMTTDVPAAIDFYRAAIGWDRQAFGGGGPDGKPPYTMWVGARGPVGGVETLPEEARAMGAPPHWAAYLAVPDVDASVAWVAAQGGKTYAGPFDIPEVGRIAICADPQGAVFGMLTPDDERPPRPDPPRNGEFAWRELRTGDREAALAFYGALCGWVRLDTLHMGPAVYQLYGRGADRTALGGVYEGADGAAAPPAWLFYIHVEEDIDAMAARIAALGGQITLGPAPVPGGGLMLQARDPQGAAFGLLGRRHAPESVSAR